jgi:hypothetical protein
VMGRRWGHPPECMGTMLRASRAGVRRNEEAPETPPRSAPCFVHISQV